MRKLSSDYRVFYAIKNNDKTVISELGGTACYSALYNRYGFEENHELILNKFLCEQTVTYHKKYLEKLSKIFKINIKYLEEDSISVTGFKNKHHIKIFLTMFRMLFEVISSYGGDGKGTSHIEKTIAFFEDFVNNKNPSPYRCLLKRYTYYYGLNKVFQGSGHGITCSKESSPKIVSKSDLFKYDSNDETTVSSFFYQKR